MQPHLQTFNRASLYMLGGCVCVCVCVYLLKLFNNQFPLSWFHLTGVRHNSRNISTHLSTRTREKWNRYTSTHVYLNLRFDWEKKVKENKEKNTPNETLLIRSFIGVDISNSILDETFSRWHIRRAYTIKTIFGFYQIEGHGTPCSTLPYRIDDMYGAIFLIYYCWHF